MLALVQSASPAPSQPDLILIGGVPGAGKSTAIRRVVASRPEVVAIDPDGLRTYLRNALPAVPYRAYRPVVHVVHNLRVLRSLWRGPEAGRPLVVHDPATRPRRRSFFARLARSRGWVPILLYVDVSREAARQGQALRGRVVRPGSFARHWERWLTLRAQLNSPAGPADARDWAEILVVDRVSATPILESLCAKGARADLRALEPA